MVAYAKQNVTNYKISFSVLTVIFQMDLGYPEPVRLHSGFYWS